MTNAHGVAAPGSFVSRPGEPLTLALIGAGNRGADVYAAHLLRHPQRARVVAVADPDSERRRPFAERHHIPETARHESWDALFARGRIADAVIVATPDSLHLAPTLRALELGYHVLLEKPIAQSVDEVLRIRDAAHAASGTVVVAHVLRYTRFFATIKRWLDEGRIGRLVTMVHLENVGYWHFAHSYVRGNWRRRADASPMILAKACHDLDLLRWLADAPCRELSAVGGLRHFHSGNAPEGAPERCDDGCPVESDCPYSALKLYVHRPPAWTNWPARSILDAGDAAARLTALRSSPYGRCVYCCDNDVADHHLVNLVFDNGVSASLTVSAFTSENTRTLKLMGSEGEIRGHMDRGELELRSFVDNSSKLVHLDSGVRHGGGDENLVEDFLDRLECLRAGGEVREGPTTLASSVESHLMAFAAEEARLEGRVVAPAHLRSGVRGGAGTTLSGEGRA